MSESFLLTFKQSYLIVPVIIILTILMVFIDSKITGKEVEMVGYLKTALWTGVICIFLVYINTLKGYIQEEISTGSPPF